MRTKEDQEAPKLEHNPETKSKSLKGPETKLINRLECELDIKIELEIFQNLKQYNYQDLDKY